ncbi:uncharacterized protein LOC126561614 [Anopheles maculipalpis]|uniref:uncharacterized protein LOC126561614 n=1 Tax=Anopheles maculipalpis TaxID=1496333 RepID=UPI002158BF50|nr:uncharacterized protein LOC126561614 [Anopheles maculipalpis]
MSETKVVINSANDLLLLGDAIRKVPLKEIAQTSLKGLRRQESDIDLYEFLFTNIIRHFEPREFEAEVLCAILPELVGYLEKIQSELQSSSLSCFFVENLILLVKLANVLLKLIEYLSEKEEQCQLLRSLAIFPEYLVRCYTIVRKHFSTMANESEALETMKTLYAVCKKLLLAFLELLFPREASGRNSNYFRAIDYGAQYDCLEKVCILLANVGNEISPIDSLLACDVWKVIVKLCAEHVEESFTHGRTAWLDEIVTILNNSISASYLDIRTKNETTKQNTIALKLNAFFLRAMLKILTLSKHHVADSTFSSIIRSLLEVKTGLRTKAICKELATSIEQYIHIGYMAIVEHSFRSKSFAKALTQYDCSTQEEIYSFYSLMMHIVTQLLANTNDNGLLLLYCNRHHLLQHVCSLLKRSDSLLYTNPTLYKQLFVHCSALILMGVRVKNRAAQKKNEETLVRMILQDEHYYTALLGIDLWSIFVRYHSIQLMYAYFLFWKKINDHYSIFISRPKQVYVRQVLRNLFVFLPATHKERIMVTYPTTDAVNDRLWAALWPLTKEIDEAKRKQFEAGLANRLTQKIQAWKKAPSNVKTFYEVFTLLTITGVAAKEIEMPQLKWSKIMNTSSAYSIFDGIERNPRVLNLSTLLSSKNMSALTEAAPFVKFQIAKLIMAANSGSILPIVNGQNMLEGLLKDKVPLVKAYAFHVLRKLNESRTSMAQELLSKQPHLRTQLTRWQSNNTTTKLPPFKQPLSVAVVHRCSKLKVDSSESLGSLMHTINSQVSELFPDNDDGDDLIQDIDVDMFADAGLLTKKRKFDATSVEDRSAGGSTAEINLCLKEMQNHAVRLERVASTQAGRLQPSQKGQLQSIIASLTKVLDS